MFVKNGNMGYIWLGPQTAININIYQKTSLSMSFDLHVNSVIVV